MTKRKVLGLVLAAATLAVAGGVALRAARGPAVAVYVVSRRDVAQKIVASGKVMPPSRVNLGVTFTSRALRVLVSEGDRVVAGQALATFDDRQLVASAAQARAMVTQARARLNQVLRVGGKAATEAVRQARTAVEEAERKQSRVRKLFASGAATSVDLTHASSELEIAHSKLLAAEIQSSSSAPGGSDEQIATASLAEAEATRVSAEAHLRDATLLAPADGTILSRSLEPGDIVQSGRTLFVFARSGETYLEISPNESNLAILKVGQRALASADAFAAKRFDAAVSSIAPSVDAQRGTVTVKLSVASPPEYLRPDMTVSVEIDAGRSANALVLPAAAIREPATPAPWVLVLRDGRAERRTVELGLTGDAIVEVRQGLAEHDVVVSPVAKLSAGERAHAARQKSN